VTVKETSKWSDTVRVNKWPSSTFAGWRRYGVVMEGVSHPARNCIFHFSINALNIYCIFPYTRQPLLLASLKPTRLLFLNPNQWNISNPYIMYVGYIWNKVQSLQTCSYTGNMPPNLRNSEQYLRKLNSRYDEIARTQNVRFNYKEPRQANYSIRNSSKSPISLMQKKISGSHLTIYD
jgi:hypothetical protein